MCRRTVGVLFLFSVCGPGACRAPEDPSSVGEVKIAAIFHDPRQVERMIRDAEPADRWALAFNYGEEAGKRLNLSEGEALASRLGDPVLQQHFWDGYAHTAPWPGDDPAAHIAAIRALRGASARVPLEDGVLMRFTERNPGDVARVVAYAERWSALTRRSPTNGVRVGLQHALGDDMAIAIAKAAEYPRHWQPELYEELGWRVGASPAPDSVIAAMEGVPPDSRCWFAHGAVRGVALHKAMDEAVTLNLSLPVACQAMGWRAVGWSLRQQHPDDPDSLKPYAERLSGPQLAALREGYAAALAAP